MCFANIIILICTPLLHISIIILYFAKAAYPITIPSGPGVPLTDTLWVYFLSS